MPSGNGAQLKKSTGTLPLPEVKTTYVKHLSDALPIQSDMKYEGTLS
jgi:hypothetical protein